MEAFALIQFKLICADSFITSPTGNRAQFRRQLSVIQKTRLQAVMMEETHLADLSTQVSPPQASYMLQRTWSLLPLPSRLAQWLLLEAGAAWGGLAHSALAAVFKVNRTKERVVRACAVHLMKRGLSASRYTAHVTDCYCLAEHLLQDNQPGSHW